MGVFFFFIYFTWLFSEKKKLASFTDFIAQFHIPYFITKYTLEQPSCQSLMSSTNKDLSSFIL